MAGWLPVKMGLLGVSENGGFYTQIIHGLIGVSIINHPFLGENPYFWKHPYSYHVLSCVICVDLQPDAVAFARDQMDQGLWWFIMNIMLGKPTNVVDLFFATNFGAMMCVFCFRHQ